MGRIEFDERGPIAVLTIVGDNDLNVLTSEMKQDVVDAMGTFAASRSLKVAVVTGAGERAFSAGGNLRGPGDADPEYFTAKSMRDWVWWPQDGIRGIDSRFLTLHVDKPVIAAVNGHCLGAALILVASLTDLRVAGENALFGFAEIKRGLPGGVGCARLARQLPHAVSMYMSLTGNNITAAQALQYGFVNSVVAPSETLNAALKLADEVSALPVEVLKSEKDGAIRGFDISREDAFRTTQYVGTVWRQDADSEAMREQFLHRSAGDA